MMIDFKHFKKKDKKMKEKKVQIGYVGDAGDYGFKEGEWVNQKVYFAVLKEMKKDGLVIPLYKAHGVFVGDKRIEMYLAYY